MLDGAESSLPVGLFSILFMPNHLSTLINSGMASVQLQKLSNRSHPFGDSMK